MCLAGLAGFWEELAGLLEGLDGALAFFPFFVGVAELDAGFWGGAGVVGASGNSYIRNKSEGQRSGVNTYLHHNKKQSIRTFHSWCPSYS